MTQRLVILLVVIVAGFCSIYALPKSPNIQTSALPGELWPPDSPYELPALVGQWSGGRSIDASENEIAILAADTTFIKKHYLRKNYDATPKQIPPEATEYERAAAGSPLEEIEVSIVKSGADAGNSIHRPERCLVAQGFNIDLATKMTLKVRGKDLPVKKLTTTQHIKDPASGKILRFQNITYYWFVGNYSLTNDHYTRTMLDLKDRLLNGYDQNWSYASVGMMLGPHAIELDEGKQHPNYQLIKGLTSTPPKKRIEYLKTLDENAESTHFLTAFIMQSEFKEHQKKLNELMTSWEKSHPNSPLLKEMQKRQSSLAKGEPQAQNRAYLEHWLAPFPKALTRKIDGTTPDSQGLTEADRILQEFIVELARQIIDRTMITAWNDPPTP